MSATKSPLKNHTLYELMKAAAADFSDYPMQKYKDANKQYQTITYKQAYDNTRAIGAGLIKLGLERGGNVGLIADVGHRWMWCSMGITNIGGVDVPRGTDATREDLRYIFSHAECEIIFLEHGDVFNKIKDDLAALKKLTTVVFFERPAKVEGKLKAYTLDELMAMGNKELAEKPSLFDDYGQQVKEEDLCTIVYTSGTTGNPKGVMLTNKSLTWEVDTLCNILEVEPGQATMGFLPPWHIAERLIETNNLRVGGHVAFTTVPSLAQDLKEINPAMLVSVPRVWESFYNKVQDQLKSASPVQREIFNVLSNVAHDYSYALDRVMGRVFALEEKPFYLMLLEVIWSLITVMLLFVPNLVAQQALKRVREAMGTEIKFAFSGAGALPYHIDRFFYSIGLPILEAYGMTETCGVSTAREKDHVVIGTVGKTIDGVQVKLVDEQGNTVTEPGHKGVAWHKGPHIMKGYYKEEEKTAEVLKDGWLNSGDIMMWTTSGELKFAGRAKDTIVLLGGENLEPEPIEKTLIESDLVTQIVIVGQDRKSLGALIVPNVDEVKKELGENGSLGDPDKWNDNSEVTGLFKKLIKSKVSAKTGFKAFERVSTFKLLQDEFQIGDELTQTMKVRRNVVFDKYATEIDAMYA